ncbi:MAG: flagellar basal body L-ring protein FlgH [Rhodospirillales bacterium]|nr:flagellar basal body L-ring protein FlgH [Rhodospirillales bacterium]
MRRAATLLAAALLLGGCSDLVTRLSEVGGPPKLSPTSDPTKDPNYRPVSLPMPPVLPLRVEANSLWRPGGRQFFKDQRAHAVGDVLTVLINVNDVANEMNSTTITRNGSQGMSVPNLFGLEKTIQRALPNSSASSLVNVGSSDSNVTQGQVQRNEQVTTSLAGVITQVLPNGNMVVVARQQMRVNGDMRELIVSGIARPEDIASNNTITHDRLAEARIVYGGRGTLNDMQIPRYGQQLLDVLLPF